MLLLIGVLILYVDIFVGTVDVVPDLVGYLFILAGFFTIRRRFLLPGKLLVLTILALILEVLLFTFTSSLYVTVAIYAVQAVLIFLFGRWLLNRLTEGLDKSEEPVRTQCSMARTGMLFLLLSALVVLPLSAFPVILTILRICDLLCGLLIVWLLYVFFSKKEEK